MTVNNTMEPTPQASKQDPLETKSKDILDTLFGTEEAAWGHSEKSLEKAIELRIQQEVTKQERYRLEMLVQRVELMRMIPAGAEISGQLVQKLFGAQPSLSGYSYKPLSGMDDIQFKHIEDNVRKASINSPAAALAPQTPPKSHSRTMSISHISEIIESPAKKHNKRTSSSRETPGNSPLRRNVEVHEPKLCRTPQKPLMLHSPTSTPGVRNTTAFRFVEPVSPLKNMRGRILQRRKAHSRSPVRPLSYKLEQRVQSSLQDNSLSIFTARADSNPPKEKQTSSNIHKHRNGRSSPKTNSRVCSPTLSMNKNPFASTPAPASASSFRASV